MFFQMFTLASAFVAQAIARPALLSADGYGPLRFGDSVSLTERKLNDKALALTDEEEGASCGYVRFAQWPGVIFMVEDRVITRADVQDAKIPNSAGLKVGTPFAEARRLYPQIEVKKNAYDIEAHDLVLKSANGKKALLFEEAKGKILSVRGGLEPSVEYSEGCL